MNNIEEWDIKKLDELVFVDNENLGEETEKDFTFYYIDISSLSEGKIQIPSNTIVFREAPSRARKIVRYGDVVMSTVRPNLKAFAYFDFTGQNYIASTGFAILTVKDEVDPRFILYSILSDSVTSQIDAYVVGSNYPAINSNAVRRLEILIPPFCEQTQIANVLSKIDLAITQTEAIIAKQQRIKTGLMQDLLTKGIDENGNIRSEATHEFKDSSIGRIPAEWTILCLTECSHRIIVGLASSTTHAYREAGIPMIRNQNIRKGYFDDREILYLDPTFVALFPNKATQERDVITVRTGSNVGDTAIVPEKYVGSPTFTTLITSTKKNILLPEYLVWYVESQLGQSELNRILVGGGKENLNVGQFINFRVALPPIEEQKLAIEHLVKIQSQLLEEEMTLAKRKKVKTGLMQDLLTGKVRVTPLLEKEPASR